MIPKIQDGYSWIKVKQFKEEDHETLEGKYEALKLHHQKETEFLIDKVRELDRLGPIDIILINKIVKCKPWKNENYKNYIFYGPNKNNILAIVDIKNNYLKIDISIWHQVSESLGIRKIDGGNYYLIQNKCTKIFKDLLGIDPVYCREIRNVIINSEEYQEGVNFFIL